MNLGFIKTAALSIMNTANPSPEAIAAHTNANHEAHNNRVELAADMITSSTHDKALNIVDFVNPAKNETLEITNIPSIKEFTAKMLTLETDETVRAYLTEKNITIEAIDQKITEINTKQTGLINSINAVYDEIREYNLGHSKEYQRSLDTDPDVLSVKAMIKKLKPQREQLLRAKRVLSLPTAADLAAEKAKWIGVTEMTSVFDDIIANDATPEKTGNRPDLVAKIFAGFSPEVQTVFKSMNLQMKVGKWDNEIEVEFIYGTDKNGKEATVQFINNEWENVKIFLKEEAGYGKTLNQIDAENITQQLREKDGVITFKIIRKDGTEKYSGDVQKNHQPTTLAYNKP